MFFLGIFQANFFDPHLIPPHIPLMIARRHLAIRRHLPPTHTRTAPWILDSGGFNDVTIHGHHQTSPSRYVQEIHRFRTHMPNLLWAAPQDYMCEPPALRRTGLSVRQHQILTTENYLQLRNLAPELPIIPVLQGQTPDDYLRHLDLYAAPPYHQDLDPDTPTIGVGSVCRRQSTPEILKILQPLHSLGLQLHGFGMKTQGLSHAAHLLQSADSAAWSLAARHDGHRPNCPRPFSASTRNSAPHLRTPYKPAQCPGCATIFYHNLEHHFLDSPPHYDTMFSWPPPDPPECLHPDPSTPRTAPSLLAL